MKIRITGFLDYVHGPEFKLLENTRFRELGLTPSSGEEETPTRFVPVEKSQLSYWKQVFVFKFKLSYD
jgi:hypothetical protein